MDPWDLYKGYHGTKKTLLGLDKEIHEVDMLIVKQLRELEGLEITRSRAEEKSKDPANSEAIRDFYKSELKRIEKSTKRAQAWLEINEAQKRRLKVEFEIEAEAVGELLKKIYDNKDPNFLAFQDLLGKVE